MQELFSDFRALARPHSNRNGDLSQLHSGEHGNARDFCFPHCMCIIHGSLLFQWIIREGNVLILSFTITQLPHGPLIVFLYWFSVWGLFLLLLFFCLLDCFPFSLSISNSLSGVFSLNNQPPSVCIYLKIIQTPPHVLSLPTVDFKKQHMYCTLSWNSRHW